MNGASATTGEFSRTAAHLKMNSSSQVTLIALVRPCLPRKRTSPTTDTAGEAGFTLVEVIVALAILSASLSVLLGMISGGVLRTASAERMMEAGSLTQSLMAEIGTEYPVRAEERAGEFVNGYRWHLKMQQYGGDTNTGEGPVGLYEISTEVQWEEGTQTRSVQLKTLRLGPKASQQ
jgi:general secretion pathway protein I